MLLFKSGYYSIWNILIKNVPFSNMDITVKLINIKIPLYNIITFMVMNPIFISFKFQKTNSDIF